MGAGSDVSGCDAYQILDFFEEPSPEKPEDVRAYANATLRVIDRVRPDFRIERSGDREDLEELPQKVVDDWKIVEKSVTKFRDALREAGDDEAKVQAAMNAFAADEAYLAADARIGDWVVAECELWSRS